MDEIAYSVNPVVVGLVGGLVGALYFAFLRWQTQVGSLNASLLVGAVCGVAGAMLLTAPLGYCMFGADQKNDDLIVGWIMVALGLLLTLNLGSMLLWRFFRGQRLLPRGDTTPGAFRGRFGALYAAAVLSPTILVLVYFVYLPMFDTLRLSTFLARFGAPRTRFICVSNFSRMLSDLDYHSNLFLSFALSFGIIIITMSLALLIAAMLNQPIKGANIYRTFLIWPYAISPIVAGSIFGLLLGTESGIVNRVLDLVFGVKVPWLVTIPAAQISVVLASVWNVIGFNILFYTAGLQTIPKDLLESASIDGASAWQRFARITFPLLSPFTFFLIVTNTIYAFFDTFGLIFVLTRGGPTESTFTAMYRVYVTGILASDIGKSTAQSLILFLIVVGITIFQFRVGQRRVQYGNY